MNFRISDTFTDSLTKLTGEEQKAVKTTAFDLQLNLANPGMQFHRLDRAKDKNFWSVRVNSDVRIIVHRTDESLLLCYVAHHNDAYNWAEKRKIETHPTTGAAQIVELRETVREIEIPVYVEAKQAARPKPTLFDNITEGELLSYGVPFEWISDVRHANEDTLFELSEHLPSEAAEALLQLAIGEKPEIPRPVPATADPFAHPDAQRRFRVVANVEELERALDAPWDKWTIFLHPSQKELVERDYTGPARISGSAGTGKTVVALHRAVFLARSNPDSNVLLTTFSPALANLLRAKVRRLIGNDPRIGERLEVIDIDEVGARLYRANIGQPKQRPLQRGQSGAEPPRPTPLPSVGGAGERSEPGEREKPSSPEGPFNALKQASDSDIREMLVSAAGEHGLKFTPSFLFSEWLDVVDAWQLKTWEEYRDVRRLGRKVRLPENMRQRLWEVFDEVLRELDSRGVVTKARMFSELAAKVAERKHPPFNFVVVDEAQDVSAPQLRFLAAMGGDRQNALFFAGDMGQRIFQTPFSWKSCGVEIRGRVTHPTLP